MLLLYCKRLFYVIYIQPQIIGCIIGDSGGQIVITIQQSLVLFCVYNKRVCEDYQVWLYNYDKRKYMAKYVTISLLYFGHVRYMTNCMATILIAVVVDSLLTKWDMDCPSIPQNTLIQVLFK